ncbi:RNA-binding protein Ro60-like [Palaemon carinicauda]|uniref:RNA-binding protein Ro60-like n=1 Tax=Palaemon carinicauda TaxID=392227 RepID=UPI0035B5E5AA
MATSDSSCAELKQLLVTGSNHAAWSGDHLVRFLVDWYQRNEREVHCNTVPPPPAERFPKMSFSPSESLLNSTSIIPKLVSEGKADIIIDTLRAYSQLPYVDKEAVVLCLAVASKQGDQKKLVTDAHSAVRELCRSTHLFFLFIQISKMISKKSGHTGWGRGLRRAVNEWYLSWEPQRLALEVTRHSSAHGWTHRDVIRLAHLKLKEMPMGTQVVLHYVFMGLEKTVKEYSGKDNTSDLLDLMQVLDKDGHPKDGEGDWDVNQVINKVNKLHEVFGSVALDDVPSQSLKSPEVWSHMLDKLGGESALASVNRMSKASLLNPGPENNALPAKLGDRLKHEDLTGGSITPTQVLMALHAYEHPTRYLGEGGARRAGKSPRLAGKVQVRRPSKVNPLVTDALHSLIASSAKSIPKTSRKLAVCIDVRASMGTLHVHTGNPEGKGEVSCYEAAAVTVLSLSSGGTNPAVSTLAFSGDSLGELKVPEGATISMLSEKFKETVIGPVNVEAALNWAVENKVETLVIVSLKFDPHLAVETLKQVNEKNNTQIRLVLCGFVGKFMEAPRTENFLLALGFDQRTPCIIRAFHERHF